jgi:hypothetical protein
MQNVNEAPAKGKAAPTAKRRTIRHDRGHASPTLEGPSGNDGPQTAERVEHQPVLVPIEVADPRTLEPHPLAGTVPRPTGKELAALEASIAQNGLLHPIAIHEGMVLDGITRLQACQAVNVPPKFVEFSGPGTPEEFVQAANVHRRHLTEGQRGLMAAELATMPRGRPKKNTHTRVFSQEEAAERHGVGVTTVQSALEVLRSKDEALIEGVRSGETSLSAAARRLRAARKKREAETNSKQAGSREGQEQPAEGAAPDPRGDGPEDGADHDQAESPQSAAADDDQAAQRDDRDTRECPEDQNSEGDASSRDDLEDLPYEIFWSELELARSDFLEACGVTTERSPELARHLDDLDDEARGNLKRAADDALAALQALAKAFEHHGAHPPG